MKRVLLSAVTMMALGAMFGVAGCVSIPWQYHSDKSVKAGDFPKEKAGLIGFAVGFEELPDDLVWEVELTLTAEDNGRELVLVAPGQNIVTGRTNDKVPVFFSLPPGQYRHKELALRFPKTDDSLYTMSAEKTSLPVNTALPIIRVAEKRLAYLGEVSIDKAEFVPGQKSHETAIKAVWNPRAPMAGNVWAPFRKQLDFVGIEGLQAEQDGKKAEPPTLIFDQTTDAAIATLNSGFSEVYALVVVASDKPGYAFFEDGNGRVVRLQSKELGDLEIYAIPASHGERFSLRGFCFSEEGPETCPYENTLVEKLFNQREFQAGEIRYRGTFLFDEKAGKVFQRDVLSEKLQASLKTLFPFASVRSFVIGEQPFVKEKYEYVFFNATGVKSKWDPISLPLVESLSNKIKTCESELRKTDPFVTSTFELFFEVGTSKKMETVITLGKGNLVGPALEILKPCIDAELQTWTGFESGEVAKGFGVRFQ